MKNPTVLSATQGHTRALTLNRPDVRNAINGELIRELRGALVAASNDPLVRLIVITGSGNVFSAGADLNWMKNVVNASREENRAEAAEFSALLEAMVQSPKPIVARVNGAALGGGTGIIAACDLAVAVNSAQLGITEVRLGLIPAMIFPYLLRKTSRAKLLQAALTGDRFDATHAEQLGLLNKVVANEKDLDQTIQDWSDSFVQAGPQAIGKVKALFNKVPFLTREAARELTLDMIADVRVSAEAQEGMHAFLEKRKPTWML